MVPGILAFPGTIEKIPAPSRRTRLRIRLSPLPKEYTGANGSDHFANRLRNDSIALKDLLAKADLKSPWLFLSTPLAA